MNHFLLHSGLERDGYYLIRGAFAEAECDRLQSEWDAACASGSTGLMRSASGSVYGARNVLGFWPDAVRVMDQPTLTDVVRSRPRSGFWPGPLTLLRQAARRVVGTSVA